MTYELLVYEYSFLSAYTSFKINTYLKYECLSSFGLCTSAYLFSVQSKFCQDNEKWMKYIWETVGD